MNRDTGQIYSGEEQIRMARARGERLAEVSQEVAEMVQVGKEAVEGNPLKAAHRTWDARARRRAARRKASRASRKRNRR